jgi:hypothetical protein
MNSERCSSALMGSRIGFDFAPQSKVFSETAIATVKQVADVEANDLIMDIGPDTAKKYAELLKSAGTIVWNGPVGVFEIEQFSNGTKVVAEAIAAAAASEDGILGIVPRRRASKTSQLQSLESELKMKLGTRVDISQSGRGKGRITIHFTSVEEFDRLRELLSNDTKKRAAA